MWNHIYIYCMSYGRKIFDIHSLYIHISVFVAPHTWIGIRPNWVALHWSQWKWIMPITIISKNAEGVTTGFPWRDVHKRVWRGNVLRGQEWGWKGQRSEPAGQHTRGDEGEKGRWGGPFRDQLTGPNGTLTLNWWQAGWPMPFHGEAELWHTHV